MAKLASSPSAPAIFSTGGTMLGAALGAAYRHHRTVTRCPSGSRVPFADSRTVALGSTEIRTGSVPAKPFGTAAGLRLARAISGVRLQPIRATKSFWNARRQRKIVA